MNARAKHTSGATNTSSELQDKSPKPKRSAAESAQHVELAKQLPRTPSMLPRAMDTVTVSKNTIDATPGKMLPFLRAIATVRAIRQTIGEAGFTDADLEQGWRLLHRAVGYEVPTDTVDESQASEAQQTLDEWVASKLNIVELSLRHRHPDQHAWVFADPKPTRSDASIVTVPRVLERLDALDHGAAREATRVADHAALATLAARGITPAMRAHLRGTVRAAQGYAANAQTDVPERSPEDARYLVWLYEARAWYEEWSGIAREVITRRDHLIRMGLAKRRAKSEPAAANDARPKARDEGGLDPTG